MNPKLIWFERRQASETYWIFAMVSRQFFFTLSRDWLKSVGTCVHKFSEARWWRECRLPFKDWRHNMNVPDKEEAAWQAVKIVICSICERNTHCLPSVDLFTEISLFNLWVLILPPGKRELPSATDVAYLHFSIYRTRKISNITCSW